jgi:hypothetical protein
MAIGYANELQQALECAVVAWSAVDQIENGVRFERLEHVGDVAADIDSRHPKALLLQRLAARPSGPQRCFARARPTPHQHADVLGSIHAP